MGFLTGLAEGVMEGANNEFSQSQDQYNKMIQQRGLAADKVAEQWAKDKDKLQKTNDLSTSYQQQYAIQPDQADALAQDPAFDRIQDPMSRLDYVKSMKPVPNQYTAGSPGGVQQVVPPQQAPSVKLGPFTLPGKTAPAVNTPSYPAQAPRQVYNIDPEQLRARAVAYKDISNLDNFRRPDGTMDIESHKAAIEKYATGDYQGALDIMSAANKKAGGANANQADPAFAHVSELKKSGAITQDSDAADMYHALGGTKQINWSAIQAEPKKPSELEERMTAIKKAHPDYSDAKVTDLATRLEEVKTDQQGNNALVNAGQGTSTPIGQSTGSGFQFSKKEVEQSHQTIQEASAAIAGINYSKSILAGTPSAAGATGELGEKFGGAATVIAGMLAGEPAANWVDKWTQASQNVDFRNATKTLVWEIAKPLMTGTGARLTMNELNMVKGIVGGLDYQHSAQETLASFENLHNLQVRVMSSAILVSGLRGQGEGIDHALVSDRNYQQQVGIALTQPPFNLTNEDAVKVLHAMTNTMQGKPPVAYVSPNG